jgi:hypothetical protein
MQLLSRAKRRYFFKNTTIFKAKHHYSQKRNTTIFASETPLFSKRQYETTLFSFFHALDF